MLQKVLSSRLIRFGAVGFTVTVFFMGLNALLSRWLGIAPYAAFLIAYPPALVLHFTLNKIWTFGDSRSTSSRHLAEYLYSVVVTFLIQLPAFILLQKGMGLPGWLAAGGANVLQMAASYGMLRWRVFHPDASAAEEKAADSWSRLAYLVCVVAMSALFAWTALNRWQMPTFNSTESDYYNLLVSGFQKGSLALDVSVPDALKAAPNPWDPRTRPNGPFLHDASFYGGRYFLYFGVVPAVILFWPFKALTGLALPFVLATVIFLVLANLCSAWLWLRIAKDRYPRAGLLTRVGGILVLGFCGGQLSLARRPSIWEMPISAGYCFATVMIAAAYLSLRSLRPRVSLAIAGVALGLAVGCRPTLVACGGGLAVLVLIVGWREAPAAMGRLKGVVRAALWAGVPLAAVMGALFLYNFERFGSPFEFGIKYQLNTNLELTAQHFRASFVPFNFRAYFLSVPRLGRYFPFLHQPELGPLPGGYYGTEFVYGFLVVCPVIFGVLLAAFAVLRGRAGPMSAFAAYVAALAIPMTAFLLCFDTAAARYTVDFVPLWLWLAMIGWAEIEGLATVPGPSQRLRALGYRAIFGLCVAVSLLVAFTLSLVLHGILVFQNPDAYTRIARVFNRPVAAFERLFGERYGKLEMDVQFPKKPSGSLEPLAVTGVGYESDYFFAYYRSDGIVQLGFENSGDSMLLSREIHYDPSRVFHIGLTSGSILPPEGHPVFAGWSTNEVQSLLNWVRIDLDGKTIINQERQTHEGAPELLQVGRDVRSQPFGARFTGTISNVHRETLKRVTRSAETHGDVVLDVNLPTEVVDGSQPLVVVGKSGEAELLGYRTLDSGHFCITYEYWGAGLWESPPIEIPPDHIAEFRIRLGSILKPDPRNPYYSVMKDSVIVWMNDKAIYWRKSAGTIEPNPKVEILANLIGSSAMRRSFQGVLTSEHREPPPTWRPGPFKTLQLYLGGRGSGSQPLVATGATGRADTLAIQWLPDGRARFLYDHWGTGIHTSRDFDWTPNGLHRLRIQMPSFQTLDNGAMGMRDGQLRVTFDDEVVMDQQMPYYDAGSITFAFGRNVAGSSVAGESLDLYLGDIQQTD